MGFIESKQVTLKNQQQVCIRTPIPDDAAAVIRYLKEVFLDDRFFATTAEEAKEWQTVEKERDVLDENLQDDNKIMLVTVCKGNIVSFSNIHVGQRRRNQHVGQLGISILPQFRGIGLGTAVMQTMINWAAVHPVIEKLALGVWSQNKRAIGLYKKMGFIEEGRKVHEVKYSDGTYDDCICMYRFV